MIVKLFCQKLPNSQSYCTAWEAPTSDGTLSTGKGRWDEEFGLMPRLSPPPPPPIQDAADALNAEDSHTGDHHRNLEEDHHKDHPDHQGASRETEKIWSLSEHKNLEWYMVVT